jgi:hypothetical protein
LGFKAGSSLHATATACTAGSSEQKTDGIAVGHLLFEQHFRERW